MDTVNAKEPAILVDWDDVQAYPLLAQWVAKKQKNIKVVLLVTNPKDDDFEHGDNPYNFEPDVVLRNSIKSPMPNLIFKTTAIVTLQESSNLVPVVAADINDSVIEMYEDAGVVMTLGADRLAYMKFFTEQSVRAGE